MISALQRDETDGILKSLYKKAKPGEWKFKSQEVTNLSLDERAHEIVREKVFKYFSKVFSCCFAFFRTDPPCFSSFPAEIARALFCLAGAAVLIITY